MTNKRLLPWWAELPLISVTVAVTIGFMRVYDSWDFLVPLLAFGLGAHATAVACRRLRVPAVLTVGLAVVGAAVAAGLILFPETTFIGLPTRATWQAAGDALSEAREQYPVVIAPTAVLAGFQLAAGLALWTAAWLADWTAHRLRATAEAVAPATAIFVFCAILGSGDYRLVCASLFASSALLFIGVQRALAVERDQAWLPTGRVTARSVLQASAALAVLAVVAGVAVGPGLPGADSEAAVTWRDDGEGDRSRVTVSPMVELRKRLVDQSNVEVFQVRSNERAYWRLTSLDTFDGEIWSSSGEFKRADEELSSESPPDADATTITQQITIKALATIWAPTAFEATSLQESETDLRWDPDSSTLIVESSRATSDGLQYTVVSKVPTVETADLRNADTTGPDDLDPRYLSLPADFPEIASDQARSVVEGAETQYQQAMALQNWFRTNFDYSLDSPAGHGDDALVDFLESGVGYCEQFAGAYAAMARSLGIPARVAVGFTPGNEDPDDPGLYRVLGRHAHAWPEVYFPGTGWVAFEPTPGRGMPGAESYTGIREQQDQGLPVQITTTTTAVASTTTPSSSESRPRVTQAPESSGATTNSGDPEPADDGLWTPQRTALAVALAVLAIAAVAVLRGRRRAAHRYAHLAEADRAWATAVRALTKHRGLAPQPSETHLEFAERASDEIGGEFPGDGELGTDLRELAALVTERRWSGQPAEEHDDARATILAERMVATLGQKTPAPVPG